MQSFRGYGQVTGEQGRDGQKKKRLAIIGVSSIILVAMVVAVAVGVSHHSGSGSSESGSDNHVQDSMKAIKTICQPTDYKEACVSSLTSVAGSNTTDPKELVKLSFEVALEKVKKVAGQSALLKEVEKDPGTRQALSICDEIMDYAIDELKNSIDQVGGFDLSNMEEIIENIRSWLSAAITYQETCVDAFENTTSKAGEQMKKVMKTATKLTSNTLAIVTELSDVFASFKIPNFNRRLLSTSNEGFPEWVSQSKRRLFTEDTPAESIPDVVVAQDGSGNCTTVNEALALVPAYGIKPFVIYVKEGIYKENVNIEKNMTNVFMIGDGPTKSVITAGLNFVDGVKTFNTATVGVVGNGFVAKNMGFENSAGAEKHQAVALRVESDFSIFYNCQMDGYQDTLYAHTHRQFYRECTISGTIDFIFGNSAVVFQNCQIVVRKPLDNQQNTITAQGRTDRRSPTALILHNCSIVADPEYYPLRNTLPTYLGRPWKEYSRAFILQSEIDDLVQPAGWLPWAGDFALNTLFYSEYDNRGPGAATAERVKWRGLKSITAEHAEKFTVARFLGGTEWIKNASVPFIPGLIPQVSTDTVFGKV
ncbi:pectinesterase [Amborella trichopoda]|uniref:Pectinesterase n=1 Tax=Amborella trichopoda TaxID=13333 RepID=W1P6V9_AMBTC|nr:pectinesterase [Amborella trichopoda]ERN03326.1 hypothetical protein AMTR_s00003p00239700 [Amborella trichopoda]|eukprot:XP_006841651.1 pectinesterase [Amborella trichopoda]